MSFSPGTTRRVKTDLKTSENIFLRPSSSSSGSKTTSPIKIKKSNANNATNINSAPPTTSYLRSHLPARATRLLNRSRLQQQQLNNGGGIGVGSDSPKSNDSFATKRTISSRSSSINQHQNLQHSSRGDSSDDLMLYDKSFRNGMLQDILYFKKQVLKLRKILQESDTLNPFDDVNGDILNGLLESSALLDQTDDPQLELTDLQRQVVYLQGQITDRDRTIRLQKNQIEKLENDLEKFKTRTVSTSISEKEVVNSATQTERVRPPSIAQQELSRSKPEYTSYVTHFPAITDNTQVDPISTTRRHTVISTTFTNYHNNLNSPTRRRSSIGWEAATIPNGYKPVKITLIGEPIQNGFGKENHLHHNHNHNNQQPTVTIV